MNLSEELSAIVDALDAQGIPYAVCGGYAVMLHGYPRATYDLDLLVPETEIPRVETAVRPLGFDVPAGFFAFKRGTPSETRFWRVSKFADGEHLVLDVLLVTPVFQDVWHTRCQVETGGKPLWAVSLEGLATMKKLSGRTKDLLDLQKLGIVPHDDAEPEPL